jgi:hypothetical protein
MHGRAGRTRPLAHPDSRASLRMLSILWSPLNLRTMFTVRSSVSPTRRKRRSWRNRKSFACTKTERFPISSSRSVPSSASSASPRLSDVALWMRPGAIANAEEFGRWFRVRLAGTQRSSTSSGVAYHWRRSQDGRLGPRSRFRESEERARRDLSAPGDMSVQLNPFCSRASSRDHLVKPAWRGGRRSPPPSRAAGPRIARSR